MGSVIHKSSVSSSCCSRYVLVANCEVGMSVRPLVSNKPLIDYVNSGFKKMLRQMDRMAKCGGTGAMRVSARGTQ